MLGRCSKGWPGTSLRNEWPLRSPTVLFRLLLRRDLAPDPRLTPGHRHAHEPDAGSREANGFRGSSRRPCRARRSRHSLTGLRSGLTESSEWSAAPLVNTFAPAGCKLFPPHSSRPAVVARQHRGQTCFGCHGRGRYPHPPLATATAPRPTGRLNSGMTVIKWRICARRQW